MLRGGLEVDAEAGSGGEGDEHFETELFPFACYRIRDAGLTAAQEFGRLRLRQLLGTSVQLSGRSLRGHSLGRSGNCCNLDEILILWGFKRV